MSGEPFHKSNTYHYPSGTALHQAACGVVIRPDDLSEGLTGTRARVNCTNCRALWAKAEAAAEAKRERNRSENRRRWLAEQVQGREASR